MKLLIIEDEHKIANSLRKGFEQEKYIVDVVYDGTDGFDLARDGHYDLIVLDLMLPGMDGKQICQNLRVEKIQTPILMLTAKGELRDKVSGLDLGADDYMTKPFAFEELLARIRALGRRPHQSLDMVLSCEDLAMNTTTFQVRRNNKIIELTSKEYALLEYLIRHSNQTLTKDQIIAHVWDYDSNILPNTVEVFIKSLRNKIDRPFPKSPSLIRTVRGFGYKLGKA